MAFKKGYTPWNKGEKTPKEVRKKQSEAHNGKRCSAETRRKISKANKGKIPWSKGKKLSKKIKEKMSNIAKKNRKVRSKTGKLGARRRWKEHIKVIKKKLGNTLSNFSRYYKYPKGTTPLEKKRFTNMRYKARKKEAIGNHTFGEWELLKKQYGYTCPACGRKEPEIKLTEDHIIPLSKGGSDYIENIQPLCVSCNTRKYTKTTKYKPVSDKNRLNHRQKGA